MPAHMKAISPIKTITLIITVVVLDFIITIVFFAKCTVNYF